MASKCRVTMGVEAMAAEPKQLQSALAEAAKAVEILMIHGIHGQHGTSG